MCGMTRSESTIVGRSRPMLQGRHAVGGGVDGVAPALDELLQPHALRGVVFDDQHAIVRVGRSGASSHWCQRSIVSDRAAPLNARIVRPDDAANEVSDQ